MYESVVIAATVSFMKTALSDAQHATVALYNNNIASGPEFNFLCVCSSPKIKQIGSHNVNK